MKNKLDRFKDLLMHIFELDKSDLDFGIYRILNLRKTEIEKFLTNDLPYKVQDCLAPFAQKDREEILQRLEALEDEARQFGRDIAELPPENPKAQEYAALRRQLEAGTDIAALETDVYSALYTFFNRYYDEGDFISQRRFKDDVYAIPYEGTEVKLYWANQEQYYVKTSENFKDYTFVEAGVTVHFRLVDATTEQNNNTEGPDSKRTFMLYTETPERPGLHTFSYDADTQELVIRFIFDVPADRKKKYFEDNLAAITTYVYGLRRAELNPLLAPIVLEKGKTTTLLEKHLKSYVAKNTFDYFIHKDLRGFLTRELDFYIKTEIMHLDDLDTQNEKQANTYLAKIRAIKRIGQIIIDFLSQIEDFQKKLWLKKKFVVQTDWCLTLDTVEQRFWPEIVSNQAQLAEWISLYAIDEADGWTAPPTVDFLRRNTHLVVDTRHFTSDFKERLIASIDRIDARTNGVMIKSENFQALSLLMARYADKIKLIYIDPPYNTDASKILYKNGYEHSSWLSLMESRLTAGRQLLTDKGIVAVAIDDYELRYLSACMDQVFGPQNAISNIAILTNPKGRDQGFIAQAHDYTVLYAKDKRIAETNRFILSEEELAKKFSKSKEGAALRELPLKRTGSGKWREERPYMYFPFFYNPETGELLVIPEEHYRRIYDPDTHTFDDAYLDKVIGDYAQKGYHAILPLGSKGERFRWRWGYASCVRGVKDGLLFCKPVKTGGYAVYQYDFADEEATPKSLWTGERYDASSKGTNLLENMLPHNPFDYPKSLYTVMDNLLIGSNDQDLVLDFFAGSGTTGQAVIELNRTLEDSDRRYILVDMGEYFDTVTKPRILKAVYADDWKDGKPQNRTTGVSHIMKYMSLESYEDALSNIELAQNNDDMMRLFGDEYLIHYMIDLESRGSLLNREAFKTPFSYRMKITEKNECRVRPVDVCETFNYLVGLTVERQDAVVYFRAEPAENPRYEGAVVLIQDIDGPYAFKQIAGTLPDGRRALVLWRTVTEDLLASNAALDAYFLLRHPSAKDRPFDVIYVNGDNNLENLRTDREDWTVQPTETAFKASMFEET